MRCQYCCRILDELSEYLLLLVKQASIARLRLDNNYTSIIYVSLRKKHGSAKSPIAYHRYLLQVYTYFGLDSRDVLPETEPVVKQELVVDYVRFGVNHDDEKAYLKEAICSIGGRVV